MRPAHDLFRSLGGDRAPSAPYGRIVSTSATIANMISFLGGLRLYMQTCEKAVRTRDGLVGTPP